MSSEGCVRGGNSPLGAVAGALPLGLVTMPCVDLFLLCGVDGRGAVGLQVEVEGRSSGGMMKSADLDLLLGCAECGVEVKGCL